MDNESLRQVVVAFVPLASTKDVQVRYRVDTWHCNATSGSKPGPVHTSRCRPATRLSARNTPPSHPPIPHLQAPRRRRAGAAGLFPPDPTRPPGACRAVFSIGRGANLAGSDGHRRSGRRSPIWPTPPQLRERGLQTLARATLYASRSAQAAQQRAHGRLKPDATAPVA